MNNTIRYSMTLLCCLLINACGSSSNNTNTGGGTTPSDSSAQLKRLASNNELETHIKSMLLSRYGKVTEGPIYTVATEAAADSGAGNEGSTFSQTNTQESDVDEADRIKTDGQYIYTASLESAQVQIFQANANNTPLAARHNLTTPDERNLSISGLYLPNDLNQLIALTGDNQYAAPAIDTWFAPDYWLERKTDIFQLDITNPHAPRQSNHLTLDGETVSSRRIGSTLYLVTRHTPDVTGLEPYPGTEAAATRNRDLIEQANLSDLLPHYQLNQQNQGALFQSGDCYLIDYNDNDNQQASIISLLAIDLSTNTLLPNGRCFAGYTETVYASTEAMYLATTQHRYQTDGVGNAIYNTQVQTDLHKFAFNGTQIDYKGSGSVEGHLGWQQDLKPFRMSEHQGTLRVITFTGDRADSTASPATLYTLQENAPNQTLDVLAKLPNDSRPEPLGKPGEQIYAVRFLGDRGYLVTFRMTDPLYVIDLSNPSDPTLLSELEIEGYSDYLHPVGEHYLLGIGKDAIADNRMGDDRGAWYQGVKLSLIDISNPQAPYEKQKLIIGKRGTETAVSQTHHALTTLLQGKQLRVALPISRHETPYADAYLPESDPSYFYNWTQDELFRLNIDTEQGVIQTRPALLGGQANHSSSYSWQWPHDRSVMIGDYVYYLHGDKVLSSPW